MLLFVASFNGTSGSNLLRKFEKTMIKEAMLYEKLDSDKVHCYLCSHHCKISEGKFGICGVRKNIEGKLHTLVYGEIIAAHVDPIEKKPLYHFLPGSFSYSIATMGCNFRCGFCQNWEISQQTKNVGAGPCACPSQGDHRGSPLHMSLEDVVAEAKKNNCKSISYTYTEPTIFFEFAYDTAKLAKKEGIKNVFVTNGFMTKEAIDMIRPYLDAANVDLKFFKDESYKKICKARLQPVLDSIKFMHEAGIWVEVTTLVIPGVNDSDEEFSAIAKFLASVNKGIPWHANAFHADYKFTNYPSTPAEALFRAREAGVAAGLKYIHLGGII